MARRRDTDRPPQARHRQKVDQLQHGASGLSGDRLPVPLNAWNRVDTRAARPGRATGGPSGKKPGDGKEALHLIPASLFERVA